MLINSADASAFQCMMYCMYVQACQSCHIREYNLLIHSSLLLLFWHIAGCLYSVVG